MPQSHADLIVSASKTEHSDHGDGVQRKTATEHELLITLDPSTYDREAYIAYMFITEQQDTLVETVLSERAPDVLDEYFVNGRDAELGYFDPSDEAIYLAALRAAEESYADDAAEQLLRWLDGEGDFEQIREGRYKCRRILYKLIDDAPAGVDNIDAASQLTDAPFETEANV